MTFRIYQAGISVKHLPIMLAFTLVLLLPLISVAQDEEEVKTKADFEHNPRSISELPPLTDWEKSTTVSPDGKAAVILFSSGYKSDNWTESTFTVVRRLKIFEEEALHWADFSVMIKPYEDLTNVEGRTILPDGSVIELEPDEVERISVSYENIWGPELIYSYAMPDVSPGAIVEYSYTVSTQLGSGQRFNNWYIQNWIYTIDSRYTLDMPEEFMPYTADLENISSSAVPDREIFDGRRLVTFRFGEIPALEPESNMPPASYLLGRLIVDYEWIESSTSEPISFWMQVGRSQAIRVNRFLREDEGLDVLVRELVDEDDTPENKIKTINTWVQQNIINLSASPPESLLEDGELIYEENYSIEDVLQRGYGTSLDLTQLAIGMMRKARLEAYLALAVSRDVGVLRYTFLDPQQFDQAFVAVRLTGDKGIFVHPGAPNCPALGIPWRIQGALTLICTPFGSMFSRLPVDLAEDNGRTCEIDLVLSTDGTARGTVECSYLGQANMDEKTTLQRLPTGERKAFVRDEILKRYPGATIENIEIRGLDNFAEALQVSAEVLLPGYATPDDDTMLLNPGFLSRPIGIDSPGERRRQPVYLPYPFTRTIEERISLPDGWTVEPPGAQSIRSDVGDLVIGWEQTPGGVVWRHEFIQKRIFFDRSEVGLLARFLAGVADADSEQIARLQRP